jgi:hypothetical protein
MQNGFTYRKFITTTKLIWVEYFYVAFEYRPVVLSYEAFNLYVCNMGTTGYILYFDTEGYIALSGIIDDKTHFFIIYSHSIAIF